MRKPLTAATGVFAVVAALIAPATGTAAGAPASAADVTPAAAVVSATQVSATGAPTTGAISDRVRHRKKKINGASSSINWAGYAQQRSKGSVKSISGSFTVPAVATSPRGYASTWVGIDGFNDQYLAQVGIGEEAVSGRTNYYGWWEIITPTKVLPEQVFKFAIKPGQRVTATVTIASGKATMTLFNNTTGAKAAKVYPYAGPGASSEWIQEDVYVNGSISPAPNWKSVSFTSLTVNGARPKLVYAQSIDIVDRSGVRETNTLKPNSVGNGFIVNWLASGHWTPVN